jgi:hypothetical protein
MVSKMQPESDAGLLEDLGHFLKHCDAHPDMLGYRKIILLHAHRLIGKLLLPKQRRRGRSICFSHFYQ